MGDTTKYRIRVSYIVFGSPASYSALLTETVTESESEGYAVSRTLSDYEAVFEGDAMKLPDEEMPMESRRLDPHGGLLSLGGAMTGSDAFRTAQLDLFRAKDGPVSVGDSWTSAVLANEATGVRAGTASYKVESEESIAGERCFVVSFDYKETEGSDPITASGKHWVRARDGVVMKLRATWNNAPLAGFGAPPSMTVEYDAVT